jgi:hypothetical protein
MEKVQNPRNSEEFKSLNIIKMSAIANPTSIISSSSVD